MFDLGFIILCNWVLMGFMYIGFEDCFYYIDKLVYYFVEWVWGGVGLIVIGGYFLNRWGELLLLGLCMDNVVMVLMYCYVIVKVYNEGGRIVL